MASRGYLHPARDHPSIVGYRRHRALRPAGHSLQKVEICEVPTPSEDYMDYKLIALFNMGLVYLESGHHTWLWLIIDPLSIRQKCCLNGIDDEP